MSKILSTAFPFLPAAYAQTQTVGKATVRLTNTTLTCEMRATPSLSDDAIINDRAVPFQ